MKGSSRPRLSEEARAAVNARRRNAAEHYQKDLAEAWAKIDETTADLAAVHHKSLRRVQSELHMGHLLSRTKHTKTSAWNAFCWKKNQEKENGESLAIVFLYVF